MFLTAGEGTTNRIAHVRVIPPSERSILDGRAVATDRQAIARGRVLSVRTR